VATTWIKPIHTGKGKSTAATLDERIEYALYADKTEKGTLVYGYECDPLSARSEFMMSKLRYEQITGRGAGDGIIAYHIRMSFPHGEVSSEEALALGRELAQRWTKGRHQFVVSAHTNTESPHAHIIFNSVATDFSRKFKNFKLSSIALRRLSDQICAEHGLSVIEKPKLSQGYNRDDYLGERKLPTQREQLQDLIDSVLVVGNNFGEFLVRLKRTGCEVTPGKHTAIRLPGGKKNIRFDSLEPDYTEAAIRERLMGTRDVAPKVKSVKSVEPSQPSNTPSLMVDIQAKIRQGHGEGYQLWMAVFNLKQAAKTLLFLKERGIDSYDDLKVKCSAVSGEFSRLSHEIRDIETKQKGVSELQKHIGVYTKTRAVYEAYRKSGWKKGYYDDHVADIIKHRAAKKYFDEQGFKGTLPPIATLKQEWATLESEKKMLYKKYHEVKSRHKELQTSLINADYMLGIRQAPQQELQVTKKSHDYGVR
jgi:hypothetical protein